MLPDHDIFDPASEFDSTRWLVYLGSKRKFLHHIMRAVAAITPEHGTVLDLFAGSGIVAGFLRANGFIVHANDIARYSYLVIKAAVELTSISLEVRNAINYLNSLHEPNPGMDYFSRYFCKDASEQERLFYTKRNGLFLDAVLEKLPDFPPDIKDVLMADLIYKMSRHVNTAGIMIAYKKFGSSEQRDLKRICGDIVLEVPQIVNGPKGAAFRCDALSFLEHPPMRYDCIYLDPPYTPRQYLQYYHLLEYACIPFAQRYRPLPHQVSGIDPSMYRSPYATRRDSQNAFEALVRQACNVANGLVLSYSEAGLLSEDFISSTLSQYGVIHIQKIPSSKYSGGINKKNKLTEFLFSLRVT